MPQPIDGIRKRPAMYVGGTDARGLQQMLFGLIDSTVDHFAMGRATRARLTLHRDGSATWEDDGPGIDVVPIPEFGNRPLAEVVFTEFSAGGRLARGAPYPSGATWMWDMGTVILNALSESLQITIHRDGREWSLSFVRGACQNPVTEVGISAEPGIRIRFKPDSEVFKGIDFDSEAIAARLRELGFLNDGLRIDVSDERTSRSEAYFYPNGLADFVADLNRSHLPLYDALVRARSPDAHGIAVDFCVQHNTGFGTLTRWFVNNEEIESGTHVRGFHQGLRRAVSRYGREHRILEGQRLRIADIREGLAAVISVRLRDPWFEGPTRSTLGNTQVQDVVRSAVDTGITDFFKAHSAIAEQIVSKAACAAAARASC